MDHPRELSRIARLIGSAAAVVSETELGSLLKRLVLEAMSATGARYAALGVIGEHGVLSDFLYHGIDADLADEIGHLPTGRGVLGTVIREGQPLILEDIARHPDSVGFPPAHPEMRNFLGVPVAVGAKVFGNLYLTEKESDFTDDDLDVVGALGLIAGTAVQTARLHERLRQVAITEDRQRIARYLHDSVIQDLFAVGLGLQSLTSRLDDPDATRLVNDAVDRLDISVNSLRRYIFELRDPSRPSATLDERLQELTARMGSAYPSAVRLTIDWLGKTEADDEIVLIVQEALSNSLRHARPDHVGIALSGEGREVVVEVVDDGIGFDAAEMSKGMGLSNMRSRVERLGGVMTIDTEPGSGTRLEVRLPVKPPDD